MRGQRHTLHLTWSHAMAVRLELLAALRRRSIAILSRKLHALHLPRAHALPVGLVLLLRRRLLVLMLLLAKMLCLLLDVLPDCLWRHDGLVGVGVGLELRVDGAGAAVARRPGHGLLRWHLLQWLLLE